MDKELSVGIDRSRGPNTTIYRIHHKLAFKVLEEELAKKFHPNKKLLCVTEMKIEDKEAIFTTIIQEIKDE